MDIRTVGYYSLGAVSSLTGLNIVAGLSYALINAIKLVAYKIFYNENKYSAKFLGCHDSIVLGLVSAIPLIGGMIWAFGSHQNQNRIQNEIREL